MNKLIIGLVFSILLISMIGMIEAKDSNTIKLKEGWNNFTFNINGTLDDLEFKYKKETKNLQEAIDSGWIEGNNINNVLWYQVYHYIQGIKYVGWDTVQDYKIWGYSNCFEMREDFADDMDCLIMKKKVYYLWSNKDNIKMKLHNGGKDK